MLEACDRILEYVSGQSPEYFPSDRKTVDAVLRNLEVLGEAAKGVSPEIRERVPSIPWRAVAGMRDVLIHEYFGVDLDVASDVVFRRLPSLRSQLAALLAELDAAASNERNC
jgi:uncharacterized protein with HEPN domain